MPRNENFWNPYRMVGTSGEIFRQNPLTHEQYRGINGKITGEIEALTPLYIGSSQMGQFIRKGNTYYIPGSSLKGMLRSFVETIHEGCDVIQNPCLNNNQLCTACRIFGMSVRESMLQGKVCILDANAIGKPFPTSTKVILSSPKSSHNAFYGNLQNNRKFYHHQLATSQNGAQNASPNMVNSIEFLKSGTKFAFEMWVENLEIEEIAVLMYAMELEQNITIKVQGEQQNHTITGDLCYKIGGAKPLGYGSIQFKLNIEQKNFFFPKKRYERFATPQYVDDHTWQQIVTEKQKYHSGGEYDNQTLKQLRGMLLYSEDDPRSFQYPRNSWFKSHPKMSLKKIREDI